MELIDVKLGARTIKTGIAIILSLAIANALKLDTITFTAVAAVFAMQPSVKRSLKTLMDQTLGNIIGAGIAIVTVLVLGSNPLLIGLAAILVIAVLNRLHLDTVIGLTMSTLIVVMMTPEDHFLQYALLRFGSTMLGIVSAFIVNTFFFPPKYEEKLFHVIDFSTSEILKWIRTTLRKNAEYPFLKKDLKWTKKQLVKMDFYFELFREEDYYSKQKRIVQMRKVVVYRAMISSTKSAYNLLKMLHHNENVYNHFPIETRQVIRDRVETLLSAHEQILMKFLGRVPVDSLYFMSNDKESKRALMEVFLAEATNEGRTEEDFSETYQAIKVVSAILNYEEYLERLNLLVSSYKRNSQSLSSDISNIEDVEQ